MTNPLRILRQNVIDAATVSASSAVASLPSDRLQTEDVQEIWRATSTTAWVLADLEAQVEVGVAVLVNTNMIASDQVQVRLSTSDTAGVAGDAYDSGTIVANVDPVFGYFVHFFGPATGRYLRIDMTQESEPEAGRWAAGQVWAPSRDMAFGWQPMWRDPSRHTESLGQTTYIDRRRRQRGFGFTLRGLSATEAEDEIHEINRLAGTSQDILVCRNKDASNLGKVTVWGLLERPIGYPQPHPDFFEADIRVWERL